MDIIIYPLATALAKRSIVSVPLGSWCCRRPVVHHKTSVMSAFSCSLLNLIQLATAAVQSEIDAGSSPTAAGRQKPLSLHSRWQHSRNG